MDEDEALESPMANCNFASMPLCKNVVVSAAAAAVAAAAGAAVVAAGAGYGK